MMKERYGSVVCPEVTRLVLCLSVFSVLSTLSFKSECTWCLHTCMHVFVFFIMCVSVFVFVFLCVFVAGLEPKPAGEEQQS